MKIRTIIPFTVLLAAGPLVLHAAEQEPRPLFVEGYTGQVSYVAGEEITLHLSSSAAQVAVEISRMGGKVESVWTGEAAGREHAVPENASSHGCLWPTAMKLKIPPEWRSGYYHVSLRARDGGGKWSQRNTRTAEGSCYFIVRPARGAGAKVLLQFSTNTYNAYNNWGGLSRNNAVGEMNLQSYGVVL